MLWEQWRLTRVEAGQRLALGLLAAALALALNSANGVTIAMWILAGAHGFFWFSIARLNGGRFMDGYKPGFPLYLLYTRPLRTPVFVGVAMAYDAISCAALYFVSAAILGSAFGKQVPLMPVTACLVAYHLASTCIQWSTRNRIVQWVGSIVLFWPLVTLLKSSIDTPNEVGFSAAQYAFLAVLAVASFVITVRGVARQRRGDASATEPRGASGSGYPIWLIDLFRVQCPTSSATRAQLWYELRSSGLPILAVGLSAAMLIFLLFGVGIAFPQVRTPTLFFATFAGLFLLLFFGSNAFGIRSKQGRLYAGSFDATQPYGTAQMAGLKVLVRAACVLGALLAIGASAWLSNSFMGAWGEWKVDGDTVASGLLYRRAQLAEFLAARSGRDFIAMAVIASIGVTAIVAWQAAREALKVRYPRRVIVVQWLPAAWGLVIVLLALAGAGEILPEPAIRMGIMAAIWMATVALAAVTIYFVWRDIAERALTPHYAAGAIAILAVFIVAYATLLHGADVPRAGAPVVAQALLLWPILLLVLCAAVAPWALHRVRHT
jgi:hypothetical protein